MDMLARICWNQSTAKAWLGVQESLPSRLRATHYGASEGFKRARKNSLVERPQEFEVFVRENPNGFYLRCAAGLYDLTNEVRNGTSNVLFLPDSPISDEEASHLLEGAAAAGAVIAWVASEDEHNFRNRISHQAGSNLVQAWAGQDTRRYAPGIYWRTLVALEMLSPTPTRDVLRIVPSVLAVEQRDGYLFFAERTPPTAWKSVAEEISEFCSQSQWLFSRGDLDHDLEGVLEWKQVLAILNRWP